MALFQRDHPVLLVGGGPVDPDLLQEASDTCQTVIAADGGADALGRFGLKPDAIIGDLDSLRDAAAWQKAGVPVHHRADQDTTDFEKALSEIDAPLILAIGFVGARLDHTLAVMSVLSRFHEKPVVVLGEEDVICALPEQFEMDTTVGARVSLFPLSEVRGVASKGLRWPIAGLRFTPDGVIGTSNETVSGHIKLTLDRPGLLLLVPKFMLGQLLSALADH
ncbi:MAG: thiamine diphosphokinase [Pseudomonadota bacterium]